MPGQGPLQTFGVWSPSVTPVDDTANGLDLDGLIQRSKTSFDLTESSDQDSLYQLADQLLAGSFNQEEIDQAAFASDAPLEFRIAAKLVKSRRFIATISTPIRVGVVFAMWGEHHRLKPKSELNPNGEDSLRVKLDQMAWITSHGPVDWTLYAVDDGDPHHSGQIVREISADHPSGRQGDGIWNWPPFCQPSRVHSRIWPQQMTPEKEAPSSTEPTGQSRMETTS